MLGGATVLGIECKMGRLGFYPFIIVCRHHDLRVAKVSPGVGSWWGDTGVG